MAGYDATAMNELANSLFEGCIAGIPTRRKRMSRSVVIFLLAILVVASASAGRAGELSTKEIEKRNMEIVRQTHANLAAGDLTAFRSAISPEYVRHCQAMPPGSQELHGTEEFIGFLEEWLKAVSGYTDTISNMIADGDKVAYVSTMSGTQTGPLGELPATGKSFTLVNVIIQRLEDGKIVETWVTWDNVALLSQLGLMPESPDGPK
jgi:predicted ester cyclase